MGALLRKSIFFIFLTLAVALAQPTEEALVGTWAQDDGRQMVWTFRSDGSGFLVQGQPRTTARFTWALQGEELTVETSGISAPYTVVSVDQGSLVIRNERGAQVYTLRRQAG